MRVYPLCRPLYKTINSTTLPFYCFSIKISVCVESVCGWTCKRYLKTFILIHPSVYSVSYKITHKKNLSKNSPQK